MRDLISHLYKHKQLDGTSFIVCLVYTFDQIMYLSSWSVCSIVPICTSDLCTYKGIQESTYLFSMSNIEFYVILLLPSRQMKNFFLSHWCFCSIFAFEFQIYFVCTCNCFDSGFWLITELWPVAAGYSQ